jgi:hypothetical protein
LISLTIFQAFQDFTDQPIIKIRIEFEHYMDIQLFGFEESDDLYEEAFDIQFGVCGLEKGIAVMVGRLEMGDTVILPTVGPNNRLTRVVDEEQVTRTHSLLAFLVCHQ